MKDRPDAYKRGYAGGRKAMFEEIVSSFAGKQHEVKCQCESCRVMRLVMRQYLGTIQEMLGEEKYQRLANDLAVAAGQDPRPFRG